jgi:glutamate formiminotransferase/formiminotetrahydrofolate cyclodeaminase
VPDFGPARIHPTAGAPAVGARRFLVAFNANLNTSDVRVAKAIAKSIREQSGGLKNVRALGFSIEGGRRAQVSMNLVNTEATPIHRVLALVREEAARHGAAISGCEVVGLIPEYAMLDAAEHALQLESFRRDQVLEMRLKQPPISEGVSVAAFFDQVAAGTPTPGGERWRRSAVRSLRRLATMVANLTIGKKKYAAHEPAMRRCVPRRAGAAEADDAGPQPTARPSRLSSRRVEWPRAPSPRPRPGPSHAQKPTWKRRECRCAPPRSASKWSSWRRRPPNSEMFRR